MANRHSRESLDEIMRRLKGGADHFTITRLSDLSSIGKRQDSSVPLASVTKLFTAATILSAGDPKFVADIMSANGRPHTNNQRMMRRFLAHSSNAMGPELVRHAFGSPQNYYRALAGYLDKHGIKNPAVDPVYGIQSSDTRYADPRLGGPTYLSFEDATTGLNNTDKKGAYATPSDVARVMKDLYEKDGGKFLKTYARPTKEDGHTMAAYAFNSPGLEVIGCKSGSLPTAGHFTAACVVKSKDTGDVYGTFMHTTSAGARPENVKGMEELSAKFEEAEKRIEAGLADAAKDLAAIPGKIAQALSGGPAAAAPAAPKKPAAPPKPVLPKNLPTRITPITRKDLPPPHAAAPVPPQKPAAPPSGAAPEAAPAEPEQPGFFSRMASAYAAAEAGMFGGATESAPPAKAPAAGTAVAAKAPPEATTPRADATKVAAARVKDPEPAKPEPAKGSGTPAQLASADASSKGGPASTGRRTSEPKLPERDREPPEKKPAAKEPRRTHAARHGAPPPKKPKSAAPKPEQPAMAASSAARDNDSGALTARAIDDLRKSGLNAFTFGRVQQAMEDREGRKPFEISGAQKEAARRFMEGVVGNGSAMDDKMLARAFGEKVKAYQEKSRGHLAADGILGAKTFGHAHHAVAQHGRKRYRTAHDPTPLPTHA